MLTNPAEHLLQAFEITTDEEIAAPIETVFETLLEQMGPLCETPEGVPLPMKIEPWPGGRWFRDFGNNSGHLWGHVQSFKAPTLLELYGPLFLSTGAISTVQYRLTTERGATRIAFAHRGVGQIPPELRDGLQIRAGWENLLKRTREAAERRVTA